MAGRTIKFKLGEITIKNVEFEVEDERELATAAFSDFQNQLASAVQPAFNKGLLNTQVAGLVANGQSSSAKPTRKRAGAGRQATEVGGHCL